jgi:DNA gyrase/topoisomerase IV subunit A
LTSAEAKLLLLGQSEAQTKLREFADLLIEYRRQVFERSKAYKQEELREWRLKILEARKNFYDSLSLAFKNL